MTISLPPALDALVHRKMATGLYADVSDVVRDALRQMDSRDEAMSWLKQEAGRGFDELDRGEGVEMNRESFMSHFRNRRSAA
jgi:putative addiction module CopG family antidote